MKRTISTLVAGAALLLSSCSSDEPSNEPAGQSETITRDDLGDEWPFTVESGILRCSGSGGVGAVTFEADGRVYGVNGTAQTGGAMDVAAIWADSPTMDGLKINIGPVIDRGLKLCL